jgi:hypothetical protein
MGLLKEMVEKTQTTCDKCGAQCEHGWDAHVMVGPNGAVVLCEECWGKI